MEHTFSDLLAVLNANCGDVLKAHILNSRLGMNINLVAVRAPAGELERAFAESRAKLVEAEPKPRTADAVMAEFKAASARPLPVETLPKMPAGTRFEDVDPVATTAAKVATLSAAPEPSAAMEEPEEWISVEEAAALRDCGTAAVGAAAKSQGWQKRRDPSNGQRVQYLKSEVTAGRSRRKAA